MTGTALHARPWGSKRSLSLLQLADECELTPSPLPGISNLRENCRSVGFRLPFSPLSLVIYGLYFPTYSVLQHLEVVQVEHESCLPGSALAYRILLQSGTVLHPVPHLVNGSRAKKNLIPNPFFGFSFAHLLTTAKDIVRAGWAMTSTFWEQDSTGLV